jgi:hypothetical protein
MDEAGIAVWTTAIAAGAGVLGALVGGLITYWVERQRWKREDARQWDDRKYADYLKVLRAGQARLSDAERVSDSSVSVENRVGKRELESAIAQARILASIAVKDALDRLKNASDDFSFAQMGPQGLTDGSSENIRVALRGVEDAIRADLGADR